MRGNACAPRGRGRLLILCAGGRVLRARISPPMAMGRVTSLEAAPSVAATRSAAVSIVGIVSVVLAQTGVARTVWRWSPAFARRPVGSLALGGHDRDDDDSFARFEPSLSHLRQRAVDRSEKAGCPLLGKRTEASRGDRDRERIAMRLAQRLGGGRKESRKDRKNAQVGLEVV